MVGVRYKLVGDGDCSSLQSLSILCGYLTKNISKKGWVDKVVLGVFCRAENWFDGVRHNRSGKRLVYRST